MITKYTTYIKENNSLDYDKYDKYNKEIYNICDEICSKYLNEYTLVFEKDTSLNLYYLSVCQNNVEKFSIYINYRNNIKIILKSLTYRSELETYISNFDDININLEILLKHEIKRLENKYLNIINTTITYSNFSSTEYQFLITKNTQKEFDKIIDDNILKNNNFIGYLPYTSKKIQDKYKHLLDANEFDLL